MSLPNWTSNDLFQNFFMIIITFSILYEPGEVFAISPGLRREFNEDRSM